MFASVFALFLSITSAQLTLEQALQEAEQHNLDWLAAKARYEQAEEITSKAWAGYLPQIMASGSFMHNSNQAKITQAAGYAIREFADPTSSNTSGLSGTATNFDLVPKAFRTITVQPYNAFSAQLQVSQNILAPSLWPSIRGAYHMKHAAEKTRENMRAQILYSVAKTYIGILGLQESLRVQETLAETNRSHEKQAQALFDAGSITKVTLLRAQQDRNTAEQNLLITQNALQNARLALRTLLQRSDDPTLLEPSGSYHVASTTSPESMLQQALEKRPDFAATQASAQASNSTRHSSMLSYLPNIAFSGIVRTNNAPGFVGVNTTWAIGAVLNWSLLDGGLREAQLREANAKWLEAQTQVRAQQAQIQQEITSVSLQLDTSRSSLQKAQEQLDYIRESARLTDASFATGKATYLDVMDAHVLLTNAEVGLVHQRLDVTLNELSLLKALGLFPLKS